MSLKRRITIVFLAVNAITIGLLLAYVLLRSQKLEKQFDANNRAIRERTASILALAFKYSIESNLSLRLTGAEFDDTQKVMSAISDLGYWDTDPLVSDHLQKAVLVRYDEINTHLFNARPRFIFGHGTIDRNDIRRKLEEANGVVSEEDGTIVYGKIDLPSTKTFGFFFRLRYKQGDFDPVRTVQELFLLTIPGIIVLLGALYLILSKSVLQPLTSMERAAHRVGRGEYDEPIEYAARGDEIGGLARTMNQMMGELARYREHMEGLVGDATDRFKKAERHLVIAQRLAAMGQLAAGIAHEINNPLGGLLNAVRKLGDPDLPAERRERYVNLCEDAVTRIQGIVSKVLQTTPREVRLGRVALRPVVDQAVGLVAHRARKQKVAIDVDMPDDLTVLGAANDLAQVFLNLLINALDAIDGGGRVRIVAHRAGEVAQIQCEDDGTGIPLEARDRIFDLFFTTKPGGQGTGLGLGIVHNIVTGHGGSIDLVRTGSDGTVFQLTLPIAGEG